MIPDDRPDHDLLVARIRAALTATGMTQYRLAALVGMEAGNFTRLMGGKSHRFSLDKTWKIAMALKVNPHSLDERLVDREPGAARAAE